MLIVHLIKIFWCKTYNISQVKTAFPHHMSWGRSPPRPPARWPKVTWSCNNISNTSEQFASERWYFKDFKKKHSLESGSRWKSRKSQQSSSSRDTLPPHLESHPVQSLQGWLPPPSFGYSADELLGRIFPRKTQNLKYFESKSQSKSQIMAVLSH